MLKGVRNYNTVVSQLLYLVDIGEGLRPTVPISTYTTSESVFPRSPSHSSLLLQRRSRIVGCEGPRKGIGIPVGCSGAVTHTEIINQNVPFA